MPSKTVNNFLLCVFYLSTILLSLLIFKDFGISIDEDNVRIIGFLALENIYNFFPLINNDYLIYMELTSEFERGSEGLNG